MQLVRAAAASRSERRLGWGSGPLLLAAPMLIECKSRPPSLEVRQEDRDLNGADSLASASLLPTQPLVIVFFHGGHSPFLLGLDLLLRLSCLCLQRI